MPPYTPGHAMDTMQLARAYQELMNKKKEHANVAKELNKQIKDIQGKLLAEMQARNITSVNLSEGRLVRQFKEGLKILDAGDEGGDE